ncbi:hypothetical protein A2V68_00350 [candidate division Kazan bacterium RBG_13_50_9]|uniref:FAD/NAD(P)-binding domain-containing protein n=1 Tax=candidate division Kazan bacterium RBG_13_50_9 TaxID=1798535 RepID=A0A1F4NTJ8_UNCK3|nr:MAG: hypothetical protein A2V68_00350 [candidate division Kazan bacterium RBG_13_50_9]
MYDVVIIGAGAAGLSAALYAARRSLRTLVLTKNLGGQTATTLGIENYPGVPQAEGPALMDTFRQQAELFGAQLIYDPVAQVKRDGDQFIVIGESGKSYPGRALILAFGKVPRHLQVPGEQEFANKGVVYCATCDAPLFAGKDVAVVGGGSAAVDAALLLFKIANRVYLLHRRGDLKAEEVLVKRLQRESKIELMLNSIVTAIQGEDFVSQIIVENLTTKESNSLSVQGVFVEIGYEVKADFLTSLVKLNRASEIIIDSFNRTSTLGVFAAGDVTTVPFKQTIISAGEGAKAALSAYNYLNDIPVGTAIEDHNRSS